MGKRYKPPPNRLPEGDGFLKRWKAPVGTTFNCFGAEVRSVIGQSNGDAYPLVIMDMGGKWNHGAEDALVVTVRPETAREVAEFLTQAADAAEKDIERFRQIHE